MKIDERLFRKFGRVFSQGSYIFQEGDTSTEMYYILSGHIRVVKQAGQVTKILAEMGPGEYFGEMAALINASRTASAYATEDSNVAVIHGDIFKNLLRDSGEVSLSMLREMAHRLKQTNEALEEAIRERIKLTAILYFVKEWPLQAGRDPVTDLAAFTGADSPEILQVILELADLHILRTEQDTVVEFDRKAAWKEVFG